MAAHDAPRRVGRPALDNAVYSRATAPAILLKAATEAAARLRRTLPELVRDNVVFAESVDATNTLPPGSSAYVSSYFDGTYVRFVFDIPQGMPGEVTMLDLNNAISNMLLVSSNQSNGVAELLPTNPNPTLLEVAQKLDELILALRR